MTMDKTRLDDEQRHFSSPPFRAHRSGSLPLLRELDSVVLTLGETQIYESIHKQRNLPPGSVTVWPEGWN